MALFSGRVDIGTLKQQGYKHISKKLQFELITKKPYKLKTETCKKYIFELEELLAVIDENLQSKLKYKKGLRKKKKVFWCYHSILVNQLNKPEKEEWDDYSHSYEEEINLLLILDDE